MSLQTPAPKKPFQEKLRSWLLGVLLLAGLIMVISHIGELENFAILVRRAEPVWLLLALLLQVGEQSLGVVGVNAPLQPVEQHDKRLLVPV